MSSVKAMGTPMEEDRFLEIIDGLTKIKPIAVVGDLGIDKYTYGDVSRISPEAPVPVLLVTREWEKLGLAANIAHNLQTLGIKSTLCGVVGKDLRSTRLKGLMDEEGLSTEGLVCDPGRITVFKERMTTVAQQICRVDYEDDTSIDEKTARKLIEKGEKLLKDHSGVILQDYGKGTLTQVVVSEVMAMAQKVGKIVAVDPHRGTAPLFYRGANLLKPNWGEAQAMVEALGYNARHKSLTEVAKILVDKLEVEKLVITLGAQGMAFFEVGKSRQVRQIPTVAKEVFDVSGAGDTTIGLLLASLLCGASLEEALWLGNCGAGVVVAKRGTATVDRQELIAFYRHLYQEYL